jgi:Xaa-Pro aminopeptidase
MTMTLYQNRLTALRELLKERGLDGLLVSCPENRRYLSGFTAVDSHLNESSGFLLIGPEEAFLLTDFRYQEWAQAEASLFAVQVYKQGMAKLVAALLQQIGGQRFGFEASFLVYALYQKINQECQAAGLTVAWLPQENVVEQLRAIKDAEEVSLIRRSLGITERVMAQVGATLRPGLTEREVAWRLEQALHEAGAAGPSFPPMVASGPNAARPHHDAGERRLQAGEPIIIDMGAVYQGYCSDMTRTFYLGEPDARFKEVYATVRRAQVAAEEGLRAGLRSDEADGLARQVITAAGYGEAFGHSLGHGVGLAVHEAPSLSPVAERAVVLQAGMISTVEPGIYLPDWGGVRLEDMVLIQEDGARLLNQDRTFYQFD